MIFLNLNSAFELELDEMDIEFDVDDATEL